MSYIDDCLHGILTKTRAISDLKITPPSILAGDNTTRDKYAYCKEYGTVKQSSSKVIFLGDARVGKTSTKKLLMGRNHDPYENPTCGIDTDILEANYVDEKWKEVKVTDSKITHFEKAAADYTVNRIPLENTEAIPDDYIRIKNQAFFLVWLTVVTAIGLSVGFHNGFLPVQLTCFLLIFLYHRDLFFDFTIGSGWAVLLVIIIALFKNVDIERIKTIMSKTNADEESATMTKLGLILSFFLCCLVVGFIFGFSMGIGFLQGICVTLSLCVPCSTVVPFWYGWVFTTDDLNLSLGRDYDVLEITPYYIPFSVGYLSECIKLFFPLYSQHFHQYVTIPSSIYALAFVFESKAYHLLLIGSAYVTGYVIVIGLENGREVAKFLNIGHDNMVLTCALSMCLSGVSVWYMDWQLVAFDLNFQTLLAAVGVLLIVSVEYTKYRWKSKDTYPFRTVQLAIENRKKGIMTLPIQLALLDFAGEDIYYAGHHLFLSQHAIYLVVFKLTDAVNQTQKETTVIERLLFWLNSIFSHARHPDAKVFIVGTHLAEVSELQRDNIDEWLYENLEKAFAKRLIFNKASKKFLFAIENQTRENNRCDLANLSQQIQEAATGSSVSSEEYPIIWKQFTDFLITKKTKKSPFFVEIDILYTTCKREYKITSKTEFYRMLDIFHEKGEIYYKKNDPVLSQFVLYCPQVLIDCTERILSHPAIQRRKGHTRLEELKLSLVDVVSSDELRVPLVFLQSLGIILPLSPYSCDPNMKFVVPSLLTKSLQLIINHEAEFVFDFGCFHPAVLFLRFLSKCYQISKYFEKSGQVQHDDHDIVLSCNEGKFYFQTDFLCQILLSPLSTESNRIQLYVRRIQKMQDENHVRSYEFMSLFRELNDVMLLVVRHEFECQSYSCGIPCTHCERPIPHMYVLANYTDDEHSEEFPCSGSKTFICQDMTTSISFDSHHESFLLENNAQKNVPYKEILRPTELPARNHDVFISCCKEDRTWVTSLILPILERPPPFLNTSNGTMPLSIYVNRLEDARPNCDPYTYRKWDLQQMEYSRCVLIVLSRNYLNDYYRQMEQERAIYLSTLPAREGKKLMVIPILKENCSLPIGLKHFSTLNYEVCLKRKRLSSYFFSRLKNNIVECLRK